MDKKPGEINRLLKSKGLKVTPARKAILEIFLSDGKKLFKAAELYDLARKRKAQLNFSTVYRNLESLVAHGIVEKLALYGSAEYKLLQTETFRHHMICTKCHKTEPLPYCPLAELEKDLKTSNGFLPMKHNIEIYGYCKDCRRE